MISRFLALFVLVGTTFAQTTASPTSAHATAGVWPEGKMPGKGAKAPEVPRNEGFHRVTDVNRLTLTLL